MQKVRPVGAGAIAEIPTSSLFMDLGGSQESSVGIHPVRGTIVVAFNRDLFYSGKNSGCLQ